MLSIYSSCRRHHASHCLAQQTPTHTRTYTYTIYLRFIILLILYIVPAHPSLLLLVPPQFPSPSPASTGKSVARHDSHEHRDSHQQRHAVCQVWETLAASASHCPAHQGLRSALAAGIESSEIHQLGNSSVPHPSSAAITHGLLVSYYLLAVLCACLFCCETNSCCRTCRVSFLRSNTALSVSGFRDC